MYSSQSNSLYSAAIQMVDSQEDKRIREIENTTFKALKLYLALVEKYKAISAHCEQEWNPSALNLTVEQMKVEGENTEDVKGVLNRLGESWVENPSLKKEHVAFFLEYSILTSRAVLKPTFSSEIQMVDPDMTVSILSMSGSSTRPGQRSARLSVQLFRCAQDDIWTYLDEMPDDTILNALTTLIPGRPSRTLTLL